MKYTLFIGLLFYLFGFVSVAQSQTPNENILIAWLSRNTVDTVNFIRVQSLTEKLDFPIRNKELKLVNGGVYEFNDIRSHAQHFLFVYEGNEIKIVTDYSCESLLQLYWEREKEIKKSQKKLKLLEGLVNFIYQKSVSNG